MKTDYVFKVISPDAIDSEPIEFKIRVPPKKVLEKQLAQGALKERLGRFLNIIFDPFLWLWGKGIWVRIALVAIVIAMFILGYKTREYQLIPKQVDLDVVYRGEAELFDAITGEPLYYYDSNENGFCAFWDKPGVSSKTRNELSPLTKEALDVCREKVRQEEERIAEQKRLEEEKRLAEEKTKEEKRLAEEKTRLEAEKKKKEEEFKKYYDLGQEAFENKLYQEAVEKYSEALAINPDNVDALVGRCAGFAWLKKYDEAIRDCEKALTLDPNNILAFDNKCASFWGAGKYAEALECYDKLQTLCGKRKSCKQEKVKEVEEYKKTLKKVIAEKEEIARKINQANIWSTKGYDFYNARNYTEALKCFDQALGWNPKNVYALFNRGLCLHMLGRYTEALASFDQAIVANSICRTLGGDENECFNFEKITKERKVAEETKQLKEKIANVVVTESNWDYGSNWFEFNLREQNNVGAVFNRAEVRIWKMQFRNEPPASFKQREPFYWNIAFSITVWPSQPYCGNFSKPYSGGDLKRCPWTDGQSPCRQNCILSLKQYRNWLQEREWIEVILFGQDTNGHSINITLEGYDY